MGEAGNNPSEIDEFEQYITTTESEGEIQGQEEGKGEEEGHGDAHGGEEAYGGQEEDSDDPFS